MKALNPTAFRSSLLVLLVLLSSFSFSLFAQAPANNNCMGARQLQPSTACNDTAGTVTGATGSDPAVQVCGVIPDDDVWYFFDAQQNNIVVTIRGMVTAGNSALGKSNPAIALYAAGANDCSSLSLLNCNTNNNSTTLSLTENGLTIGRRYYIRIFSKNAGAPNNGTFNICVTHTLPPPPPPPSIPPANDGCTAAVPLTMGAAAVTGTVFNATNSNIPIVCSGNPDDDVWYRFTATAPASNISSTFPAGSLLTAANTQMQLFSGSCGSLVSLNCGSNGITAVNLVPGNIYFIRVYGTATGNMGSNSTEGSFNIRVTAANTMPPNSVVAGRMNEVFQQTILSGPVTDQLNDPWEITYGPDGRLWVNEAKGYRLHRMDPVTGVRTTVLDLSQGSTFLPTAQQSFNVQFSSTFSPWPQGGFAGLALHPNFMHPTAPKNFVYVSYVHTYNSSAANNAGVFFTNRVVRFTFNTATGRCEQPVSLCDTLPGSNDHNSQRMIIAPVDGVPYLFYASGDMGSGQFGNANRPIRSQDVPSYEGKILRFNLEPDADAGNLDQWIPNDNPFNTAIRQSAVWSTGMRNNQGFAYGVFNGTGRLFGSSHGPFSDDELNIIERAKNYGHPTVIGFAADGNYNGVKAGAATGSMPLISSESANATAIGSSYQDPFYSAYAASSSTVVSIYNNQTNNGAWPSEGWSGMDLYNNTVIPGWNQSLIVSSLKWGRLVRLRLNATGTSVVASGLADTVNYFGSRNRFRDLAIDPNGRDLYVIMDKSSTTSGPTANNPVVSTCAGCVHKYSFLGYGNDPAGKSTIPSFVDIGSGTTNNCIAGTQIIIDNTNTHLWVPITGPDGNILAEIRANGNNLGVVNTTAYIHTGTARQDAGFKLYGNRSLTITPQTQPTTPVSIRLYLTNNEYSAMLSAMNTQGKSSGITNISDVSILKNNDACGSAMAAAYTSITPVYAEAHGSSGYVLQANINSFSSFYFGNPNMEVLPLRLVTFAGAWKNNTAQLQWKTAYESNTSSFEVERSLDGQSFRIVGTVQAAGNSSSTRSYQFGDRDAAGLQVVVIYYRLRMLDANGSFTYSNVVTITVPALNNIVIFPSPVERNLNVKLNTGGSAPVQVIISDIQGRAVYTQQNVSASGTLTLNIQHWKAQLYVIKVLNQKGEIITIQKFQKI